MWSLYFTCCLLSSLARFFTTSKEAYRIQAPFMTYHLVCNQSNTTGATSGPGIAYTSAAPQITSCFQQCLQDSCCSIFSFLCDVQYNVVCPLVLFLLAIVLPVIRFTDSDYPFGIFQLFLTVFDSLLQHRSSRSGSLLMMISNNIRNTLVARITILLNDYYKCTYFSG